MQVNCSRTARCRRSRSCEEPRTGATDSGGWVLAGDKNTLTSARRLESRWYYFMWNRCLDLYACRKKKGVSVNKVHLKA